jgi:hypothetical protein
MIYPADKFCKACDSSLLFPEAHVLAQAYQNETMAGFAGRKPLRIDHAI